MSTHATLAAPSRVNKRIKANPISAGLPDPRPITDYDATYDEHAGQSIITITLRQPCVIRSPAWTFIDSETGEETLAQSVGSDGHTGIVFTFATILPASVNFVNVPYQDMQVQNFQGGFVRSGGKWFRGTK